VTEDTVLTFVCLDHNGMAHLKINVGRSRWPCCLKRRSERIWFLGSRVSNSAEVTDVRLLLGTFAKWRKATVIFVMSVRLSACSNSSPTGQIFIKFCIWRYFENLSKKSSLIKIWQEQWVIDMKIYKHLW